MLLNDAEIALNEALVACKKSAHRYEYVLAFAHFFIIFIFYLVS